MPHEGIEADGDNALTSAVRFMSRSALRFVQIGAIRVGVANRANAPESGRSRNGRP
jgi:hypothetical protein